MAANTVLLMCVFLVGCAVCEAFNQMGYNRYGNGYQMNNNRYQMGNNMYNTGYTANRNSDESMRYLPFLMGGSDSGRKFAQYSMMFNTNTSPMARYYMMQNGPDNMWPMMAFMNRNNGQRGFNPFLMMTMQDAMN